MVHTHLFQVPFDTSGAFCDVRICSNFIIFLNTINCFLKNVPFFFSFRLSKTVDRKQMFHISLPMNGFEPRTSGIRSDHCTNLATTTAPNSFNSSPWFAPQCLILLKGKSNVKTVALYVDSAIQTHDQVIKLATIAAVVTDCEPFSSSNSKQVRNSNPGREDDLPSMWHRSNAFFTKKCISLKR